MARPLRIEFAGALYHVTSRGNGREDIYLDDEDRELFMMVLGEVCELFNWAVHSWCQMTNHYHLLVETPDSNLSKSEEKGVRSFFLHSWSVLLYSDLWQDLYE